MYRFYARHTRFTFDRIIIEASSIIDRSEQEKLAGEEGYRSLQRSTVSLACLFGLVIEGQKERYYRSIYLQSDLFLFRSDISLSVKFMLRLRIERLKRYERLIEYFDWIGEKNDLITRL